MVIGKRPYTECRYATSLQANVRKEKTVLTKDRMPNDRQQKLVQKKKEDRMPEVLKHKVGRSYEAKYRMPNDRMQRS